MKNKCLITEIIFQHRVHGYEHGFKFDLSSTEAINIIEYLKSFGHWYPSSAPTGGVEILQSHGEYIDKYILKRKILKTQDYEVLIGFIGENDFKIFLFENQKVVTLSAYFIDSTKLAFRIILTSYFAKRILEMGFDWSHNLKLSREEFLRIRDENRRISAAPLEVNIQAYNFTLETMSISNFTVNASLASGLAV